MTALLQILSIFCHKPILPIYNSLYPELLFLNNILLSYLLFYNSHV